MDQEPARRGVVVRVIARLASTEQSKRDAEHSLVSPAGMTYGDREGHYAYFGDLAEDSRRRLGLLLRAAEQYGTDLELGIALPPISWRAPVLAQPVPRPGRSGDHDEQHGFVEPANVDTMLVIDVQYQPGGPCHQWWLSAEPPRGTHPDPAGAWETLCQFVDTDPFAPAPPEYTYVHPREPGQATVQGIWRGRWVQARFDRQHDAEIARWDRLAPLLKPTTRSAS